MRSELRLTLESARPRSSLNEETVADSGARMQHLLLLFGALLLLVFCRVVQLELTQGEGFRGVAARPLEKSRPLVGTRGRIVSRDGVVLATDGRIASLAVHYRYLEDPPNTRWLRRQARARVRPDDPQRAARLMAEQSWVREYRDTLVDQLARLCGRPIDDLQAEQGKIQKRVRAIAAAVNRARDQRQQLSAGAQSLSAWQTWATAAPSWLFAADDPRVAPRIIVAEELDYHVLVPDVPLEVIAEVESHPEQYPGVRIVEQSGRHYPRGALAANLVGHLGMADEIAGAPSADSASPAASEPQDPRRSERLTEKLVGRMGLERQYERELQGRDGLVVDFTDHSGRWLSSRRQAEPAAGADLVLTVDARLQQLVEERLDRALAMADRSDAVVHSAAGGAVVIMDVHSGAILASATAPRFNPNAFARRDTAAIERLLADPAHPLFDRATKMAIPPGSVFKVVTALALLAEPGFDPWATCDCQGYLSRPDRERCQIFRRFGVGHGETDLSTALARSCNVYFFQHAAQLAPARLADWALRLGFGRASGVDLPGEASGFVPHTLPSRADEPTWKLVDTQAFAIGQSRLTATPLQIARLMAAVANGGTLVTPHVVACGAEANAHGTFYPPAATNHPIQGLNSEQLAVVRRALERVVEDPEGTAYAALADTGLAVAGKTGTAETGARTADHAWFAGYAPADAPRAAFAVALEHRGSADRAAALAKELVQGLEALGLLAGPAPAELVQADEP
ncbi:MAG TPA: penicillin-binding transpeptidase domain-containing protein [Pirellulales bacterium]|nr:penicillin-binding transpeptidase domain-containing protein [Pirellulales bacterium]